MQCPATNAETLFLLRQEGGMQQAAILATPEITESALNNHRRLEMNLSQASIMATSMKTMKNPHYHFPTLGLVKECNN